MSSHAFSKSYTPRIVIDKATARRAQALKAREEGMNSTDPDRAWAARGTVPGLGQPSDLAKVGRILKPSGV